jgi:hypothetical protein
MRNIIINSIQEADDTPPFPCIHCVKSKISLMLLTKYNVNSVNQSLVIFVKIEYFQQYSN